MAKKRHTAEQIIEAFPEDHAPWFMIRDRDSIYGAFFQERVKHMGIEQVVIASRSPWQSPYVERLIGSIRCKYLNHLIVRNERYLLRILRSYSAYYHEDRAHLSLDCNSPVPRDIELPNRGKVIAIPQVGGSAQEPPVGFVLGEILIKFKPGVDVATDETRVSLSDSVRPRKAACAVETCDR